MLDSQSGLKNWAVSHSRYNQRWYMNRRCNFSVRGGHREFWDLQGEYIGHLWEKWVFISREPAWDGYNTPN
jgi:hypothetical protein